MYAPKCTKKYQATSNKSLKGRSGKLDQRQQRWKHSAEVPRGRSRRISTEKWPTWVLPIGPKDLQRRGWVAMSEILNGSTSRSEAFSSRTGPKERGENSGPSTGRGSGVIERLMSVRDIGGVVGGYCLMSPTSTGERDPKTGWTGTSSGKRWKRWRGRRRSGRWNQLVNRTHTEEGMMVSETPVTESNWIMVDVLEVRVSKGALSASDWDAELLERIGTSCWEAVGGVKNWDASKEAREGILASAKQVLLSPIHT